MNAGAPAVAARAIGVRFPNGVQALADLDLSLAPGEILAVVGPSGCGKSTLLRAVAGLLAPTEGRLDVPSRATPGRISLVFQQPALLPWRTVADNVSLPLQLAGMARGPRRERARHALGRVGLLDVASAWPHQLSGGMQMRASFARAVITDPELLLLDEPFAAVDELTREHLQDDLLALHDASRFAALLVTHHAAEAAWLADRVLVLSRRPGRVVAEVRPSLPRPRRPGDRDAPALTAAAASLSHHLRSLP